MPKNKKSLLQALKDTLNSFQDIAETEEEQEVADNIQEDVEKLEEKSGEQVAESENDTETDTQTDDNSDEQTEEVAAETYSVEETKPMLENLALSEESVKEASEFIATLSKETADKLVPLLKKFLMKLQQHQFKHCFQIRKARKQLQVLKKQDRALANVWPLKQTNEKEHKYVYT